MCPPTDSTKKVTAGVRTGRRHKKQKLKRDSSGDSGKAHQNKTMKEAFLQIFGARNKAKAI
jgi:hypothetical protein